MLQVKFTNATSAILYNDLTSAVITPENGVFTVTEPLSKNDQDYYHFIISGENVKVSGYIDSVTEKQQYINLFKGCTQITDASKFKLSTFFLTEGCFQNMFLNCTNLQVSPMFNLAETPVKRYSLAPWCCAGMYAGCKSLTSVTYSIPNATTLAPYCYYGTFYNCSSLSSAPNLPARTLADWCYNSMFYNCSSLTGISASFSAWTETGTKNWVTNVAPSGNFVNDNVDRIYSNDNVPVGWIDWNTEPLTFTGKAASNAVQLNKYYNPYLINLSYKKNNGPWTTYNIGDVIELNKNEFVKFSGANEKFSRIGYGHYYFTMTGYIEANGNIQSLLNYSDRVGIYDYANLFAGCSSLLTPPKLLATEINRQCYGWMFKDCTSLTATPSLPVTSLAQSCYADMFRGCTSLTSVPQNLLPAVDLAYQCYGGMFRNTGIKYAPELPATGLAEYCYDFMFEGCSNLLEAPYLPATNINFTNCYGYMFSGCISLTSISVNFTEWSETASVGWVYYVSPTGIFTKPSTLPTEYNNPYPNYPEVSYKIPTGWTVNNIDA